MPIRKRFAGFLDLERYLILAVLACGLIAPARAAAPLQEALIEIRVNGQSPGQTLLVLRDNGNGLWVQADDLARLRLKRPKAPPLEHAGRQYFDLNDIAGAVITIDEARDQASVRVPPAAFASTRVDEGSGAASVLTRASPGAFLNYQLSGQRTGGETSGGVLTELGLFGAPGVLTNTLIGRAAPDADQAIRLDTTFTHDFPDLLETLTLGDAVSSPALWSNAVRFAGVQWGRNFALRPDLLTTPLLAVSGNAVVPSTVSLFVNNERVSSTSVPPGPFVIDRVPVVTGAGDVRLVVQDALGNEQIITEPFYSGAELLAPGLTQFAVDLGSIRENYGLSSFQYGSALASASYRRGLTNALTVEGHAEWLEHAQYASGIDLAAAAGNWGIATLTLANGGDSHDSGWLSGVGFQRQGRDLSLLLDFEQATPGFRQLGDSSFGMAPLRQRTLVQVGDTLGRAGSLSLAWAGERYQSSPAQRILSLSYQAHIGRGWFGLSVSRSVSQPASTSIYASFTLPLGERRTFTASQIVNRGAGTTPEDESFASLDEAPPVGPGFGWTLGAGSSGSYDAEAQWQTNSMDLDAEAARMQGSSGERAQVSGALTWLDDDLRLTRDVTGSFAVVDVAGVPDVPVYVDHQLVARTDSSGRAILYDMRPYDANRISIDPTDLPLDVSIGSDQLVVRPPWRSGVVARFPLQRVRGAIFRLVTPAGEALPPGASVHYQQAKFAVALDGMVYITNFEGGLSGEARWARHRCTFRLPSRPLDDPLPDLGSITCRDSDGNSRRRE
jgi:outer membrane usher protein